LRQETRKLLKLALQLRAVHDAPGGNIGLGQVKSVNPVLRRRPGVVHAVKVGSPHRLLKTAR